MGSKEKRKVSRKAQLTYKDVLRAVSSAMLGRLCKSGLSKPQPSLDMSPLLDWKMAINPSLPKLLVFIVLIRALEILVKTGLGFRVGNVY